VATLEGGSFTVPEAVDIVLVIFFVQLPPLNMATLDGGSCTVPEVVVTVLCIPDDGCVVDTRKVKSELAE